MASRWWVGSTGTWDASDTTHWSASSGGAGGASVPTSTDDVFFDGSSGGGTVTISATANGLSFDSTGWTGSLVLNAGLVLAGSLTLGSGGSYSGGSGFGITFSATSTGKTITTNGRIVNGFAFTGVGGGWTFQDAVNVSGSAITLTAGTLNTNGQSVTAGSFSSSNSNTRVLTMGSSSITVTAGSTTAWNTATVTNLTYTANTATVTVSGTNAIYNSGAANVNGLSAVMSGSGTAQIQGGTVTFANFTRTGTAVKTDAFTSQSNLTVTGTLTLTGNSATNRLLVQSSTLGTARTITAAAVSLSNVDFQDTTGAGTAAPWTGTSLGDAGGNSGITFDAPVTNYYRPTGTGNWSDVNRWAFTSGGSAASGRVPLPQDAVIFDVNSFSGAGQTVIADMPRLGKDVNWTGVTNNPTWSFTSTNNVVYGSLTLVSGMALTGTFAASVAGRGSFTITTAGKTWTNQWSIAAPTGTYTLSDAFTSSAPLSNSDGTFNANGLAVTATTYVSNSGRTRVAQMGSGAWSLSSTTAGSVWTTSAGGLTLTVSTAVLSTTGAPGSAATVTVTTGGVTMPNWTVNGGANLTCQFSDAFTTAGTITLTQAALSTNNQTVSCSVFSLTGSTARTISLGSSSITCTASNSTAWNVSTATSLTITSNTATVTLNGAQTSSNNAFAGGGVNWNGLSVVLSGSGAPTLSGNSTTVANLTRTGTAVKTDSLVINVSTGWTITGTFTVTGNSTTNRVFVQSSALGTARTITVNTTVTVTNADFQDITGAGTASWNLSAATGGSGDALGNSGITFTTGASQFWVSGTGNWSDSTKWKTTSGGAVAGRVPLPQDTAVFDASSFTAGSQTVTSDMPRIGKDITFTGVTNAPTWATSVAPNVFGSLTWGSGLVRGSWISSLVLQGRSATHTLTFAGQASAGSYVVQAFGGTYTAQDAWTIVASNQLALVNGTVNANGQAVSTGTLQSTGATTRALTMGSGAWSITGTSGVVWQTGSSGFTLTITGSSLSFTATSGTPTITTSGVTMGPTTFNGAGGSWTLNDAWTSGSTSNITLTAGTLNTNGQSVSTNSFSSSNSNVRTLTLGSSTVTVTATGTSWTMSTVTGLTVTANTGTVSMPGGSTISSGGVNFNGTTLSCTGAGTLTHSGSAATRWGNVTRVSTAAKTDALTLSSDMIITGTFTATGNSAVNRLLVQSSGVGGARSITAATTSLTNVDFVDITAAGAATWTGTSLGDATGNSGITFDAPTTQTHTASAGGNWSDVTKWTSRVPLPQDAVVVDVNTTGTLTADMPRLGKDVTFTGFAGTLAIGGTNVGNFGSVTLATGMTFTGGQAWSLSGRSSHTITSSSKSFPNVVTVSAPGGTYTATDSVSVVSNLNINTGTFDSGSQSVTVLAIGSGLAGTRVISLGSSTVTLTQTGSFNVWNPQGAGGTTTITGSSYTITLVASNVTRTFVGAGLTYATLRYDVASPSQGALVITGANSFASLIIGDGRTLTLPSSTTTTVTSSLSLSGTAYVGYLYLPGVAGSYVSTPNQAALQITGPIDVRVRVQPDTWTPSAQLDLLTKYNATGNQRSWIVFLDTTGKLGFTRSSDGIAATSALSTVSTGLSVGTTAWVRATYDTATGIVTFYTASGALTSPTASDFTALGGTVTLAAAALFGGTAAVEVGSNSAGANALLPGQFYKAEVRNGIDGTLVAVFDASLIADPFRYYSPVLNWLDKDSSDLEGSVGGWSAGTGAPTVTRDATISAEGSASLKIVSTAAGSTVAGISGSTFNAATVIPVVPGAVLSFLATVKGVAASLIVSWFDSAGNSISNPVAVAFGTAGAFTDVAGTLTAPASAMWAQPKFNWTAAGAGEVLNADKIAFQVGTAAAGSWSAGGVPWRVNGYPNNPGVPFGRTALNASTAGTAATIATGSGATVTVASVKDITATPANTVYALDSSNVANNTGIVFAPVDRLPVTRRPRAILQAVSRAGSF